MSGKHFKKNTYLILGIIMAMLFFLCCCSLIVYPFSNIFSPKKIDSVSEAGNLPKNSYITANTNTLYYTGFDFVRNNKVRGHYYYSLADNNCTFFLIKADEDNTQAKEQLDNKTITAQINYNDELLASLVQSVSKQLNWTSDGLNKMVSPYIINTMTLSGVSSHLLFAFIIICAAITFISGILYFRQYHKVTQM